VVFLGTWWFGLILFGWLSIQMMILAWFMCNKGFRGLHGNDVDGGFPANESG
jgi:hypothetical protein